MPTTRAQRIAFMIALVFAGEAIFTLPFHLARFFRPTFLEVFGFSATQLGAVQAVYGVVAMLAYFPGGPLADRFSARKLIVLSLLSTAAGGLYVSTIPDYTGAQVVWGFFGLTTILTFWAALIRAARRWGGQRSQGKAYGLLDGGRGLLAALLASAFVRVLAFQLPDQESAITTAQRTDAFRTVILGYAGVTVAAALLVWFFVPEQDPQASDEGVQDDAADANAHGDDGDATDRPRTTRERLALVLRTPTVWLQAAIIVCAYVSYKGFDNYSLYADEAWDMGEVDAARIATLGAWTRPVAAVAAGWLGDRLRASRVILALFALLLASHLFLALVPPLPDRTWVLVVNVLAAGVAIYGFRGLYFALLHEARIPMGVTGTAVGVVSVIGYTPDIFVNWIAGLLIDRAEGVAGYHHVFWFLGAFAALGLVATLAFMAVNRRAARGAA